MILQSLLPCIESVQENLSLFSDQKAAIDTIIYGYLYKGKSQGIVEAPCAFGKTRLSYGVFDELRRRDPRATMLCIVSSIDLAKKNRDEACRFFPWNEVGLVQGETREYDRPIIVASYDTITKPRTRVALLRAQRLKKFDYIWVDECHKGVFWGLESILANLEEDGALRLGTTATVWRSDNQSLQIPFPHGLFCSIDRDALIEEKRVVDFETHEVRTTSASRYQDMIDTWRAYGSPQSLVFANSVSDAEGFYRYCKKRGIKGALILGSTKENQRDKAFKAFRKGEISHLFCYEVLVTGVDLPEAEAAFIGRYSWMKGENTVGHHQATGRVGRVYAGKEKGHLFYLMTEKYHKIPQIHSSLGELPGTLVRKSKPRSRPKKKKEKEEDNQIRTLRLF